MSEAVRSRPERPNERQVTRAPCRCIFPSREGWLAKRQLSRSAGREWVVEATTHARS